MLKLLAVGAVVAMPPGPVLVLVLQKTLRNGRLSGFCTGLGAMCADTIYAVIGLYMLGMVQGFLDAYQDEVILVGGIIIAFVGVLMWVRNKPPKHPGEKTSSKLSKAGYGLQAFVCALSNPGAIALMMGLLAILGLDAKSLYCPIGIAILAVAMGEALYWFVLTWAVSRSINLGEKGLSRIAKAGSVLLVIIGIVMTIRGALTI